MLDRIESQSRLVAADLEAYVAGARGDAASLRAGVALNGLMRAREAGGTDPVDGISEKTWRERIAARLVAELEAKPAYAEIRVIGVDDSQREIVRVDRRGPNGAIQIVPDERLAPKGDKDYFRQTIKLKSGDMYVSPIDAGPARPDHHHAPGADIAGGDAGFHTRRQAVRNLHHQCRHAAGVRPHPRVGATG